jgi:tight adherence protein C
MTEVAELVQQYGVLWNPVVFAALAALAVLLMWFAFAPAPPRRDVQDRLNDYLDRDIIEEETLQQPFVKRAILPGLRSILRLFGRLLPSKGLEKTKERLQQAGNPYRMTALDFYGVRVLLFVGLVGLALLMTMRQGALMTTLQALLAAAVIAFLIPVYWLRHRVNARRHNILRAMPDALDMLTIGVEAGLAFESALIRVGEKWDNELTREFRRAVAEMRVGVAREDALQRMAKRCGVSELSTFVAVLVQSSQLGVSIAQVLHAQAAEMRLKRRQRAEELARQAGLKMIFPLAIFILPSLFVVILGPIIPSIQRAFDNI